MGKVLLISWGVPPETTGSAIIVGNLAKQFTPEEMVVVGERPPERPSVCWKEDWPEIVYITQGWPPARRGARWWRRCQFPLLLFRSLYLARKHRCTNILVVFPNEEFLLAGYLTAKLTNARFYPYFHNTFLEQCALNSVHHRMAQWLQSRVFDEADHIFLMSEGMVELYRERYPKVRCSALLHSFNEDIPEFLPPPEPASPVRFVMSGNINASCTDAATRVSSAIARIDSRLTILSGSPKQYLDKLGILREGGHYETVSRDLVLSRLSEADIVILAHGFKGSLSEEEYRTIFPTKTIEYLICGRPILAHTPPNCYLTRFLRRHQCALVVDTADEEAILTAVRRLREDADLRASLVRNALQTARQFHAPVVASGLRAILGRNDRGRVH
jgi:glycosyltransferase involved in cell wall biosynthesis